MAISNEDELKNRSIAANPSGVTGSAREIAAK
jgi:hypothetical protein